MIMIKAELFMNRHRVVLWRWLWGGDPGVLWESVVVRGVADSSDRDLVHSPRIASSLTWLRLWGGGVSGGGEGDPDHSVSQIRHRAQAVQAHLAGVALPPLVGLKVKDLFCIQSSQFLFFSPGSWWLSGRELSESPWHSHYLIFYLLSSPSDSVSFFVLLSPCYWS